jgi:hypothetical protein
MFIVSGNAKARPKLGLDTPRLWMQKSSFATLTQKEKKSRSPHQLHRVSRITCGPWHPPCTEARGRRDGVRAQSASRAGMHCAGSHVGNVCIHPALRGIVTENEYQASIQEKEGKEIKFGQALNDFTLESGALTEREIPARGDDHQPQRNLAPAAGRRAHPPTHPLVRSTAIDYKYKI